MKQEREGRGGGVDCHKTEFIPDLFLIGGVNVNSECAQAGSLEMVLPFPERASLWLPLYYDLSLSITLGRAPTVSLWR